MAWTEITRRKYRGDGLRYASDTTDAEWAVIEPHMPPPANCGRPRGASLREVVNAIFYIAKTGCQWRMLPGDFPPFTTVQRYFYDRRAEGRWQTINHALLMAVREAEGILASPRPNGTFCSWSLRLRKRIRRHQGRQGDRAKAKRSPAAGVSREDNSTRLILQSILTLSCLAKISCQLQPNARHDRP